MKKPTIKWVHECYSESFGVVSLAVTSCFTCLITPMIPQTTATAIPIQTYFFISLPKRDSKTRCFCTYSRFSSA